MNADNTESLLDQPQPQAVRFQVREDNGSTPPAAENAPGLALTKFTGEDREWLRRAQTSKQLDEGVRILGVANRHPRTGRPRVLACYPLRVLYNTERSATPSFSDRKWDSRKGTAPVPFPNTFWLVCPEANQQVGTLEHDGLIKSFAARLREDPAMQESFDAAHAEFAALRWSLLTDEDRSYAVAEGFEAVLKDCGVGGLRYNSQVKCLHLHYSHYLATGSNTVGLWVKQELEKRSPAAPPR